MKKRLLLGSIFAGSFFLFAYILTFASNFDFYKDLLFSQLPLSEKIDVLEQIFISIFGNFSQGLSGYLAIILSILQAATITLMVYAKKYSNAKSVCRLGKESGLTGAALVISFIGAGCPACGTSLIAPLIAIFVSGVTAAAMTLIGNLILVISCLICAFAILNLIYQLKTETSAGSAANSLKVGSNG